MSEHDEMTARVSRAVDRIRELDRPLGYAFQDGLIAPGRSPLNIRQLKSLEDALTHVAEILQEKAKASP